MSWLDFVKRDPVPWLLDPANPSARLLTLRDIFRRPETALAREYAAVLAWEPLRALIAQAHPVNFWGRADNPTFGGPAGTLGTLYALAQLGIPAFPQAQEACENLLRHGRLPDGRFSPADSPSPPWLCYTGMALQTLWHFGFGEDLRVRSAQAALVQAVLQHPRQLECPLAGGGCPWGMVKALAGLLNTPPEQQTAEVEAAIETLAGRLLAHTFDFTGRDAAWLDLYFPATTKPTWWNSVTCWPKAPGATIRASAGSCGKWWNSRRRKGAGSRLGRRRGTSCRSSETGPVVGSPSRPSTRSS
ncbi:MAG: hypothetical protein J7M17_00840 [Anaerolineae bacterium]|nr:hypothetical protein [Anaerolineae bacterium]